MNALELKGSILELLANIQDVEVLAKIKKLLSQSVTAESGSRREPEWLTDDQLADLQKALEETKDGQGWTSHDEHMEKFRTWSKQ